MSTAAAPISPGEVPSPPPRRRDWRRSFDRFGDGFLMGICALAGLVTIVVLVMVGYQVIHGAGPSISKFGLGFIFHTTWQPNPPFEDFGAGVMLYGTMVSSFFALFLGAPIAISIGLFLSLLAPKGISSVISPLVEMLAAIPSVILGFWGLLILAPFVQAHVEPFLHNTFGFIPIFGPPQTTGLSVFTASLILTIMIIPIVASISRDLFLSVPRELQDGAAALGATRWEVVRGVVMPSTASGVMAASLLGLGRALGEAIAVAQVIGAGSEIHASLFQTGDTLASRIANQFPGAITQLHQASLYYLGAILLVIGLASNLTAQWIGRRFDVAQRGGRTVSEYGSPPDHGYEAPAFDPMAPLTPTGNLRRRQIVSRIAEYGATAAAVAAVAVLGIVVYAVVSHGAKALSLDFLLKGEPEGIGPMLVGTAEIVAIATLIAVPISVLVALYTTEFAKGKPAAAIKLVLDLMNGLPSIILGLFVFGLLVAGHQQSGFAASVALAIIMVPLVARGSQEVLLLVPNNMREAADALGVSRWRTVLTVILPSAIGGIVTSTVLAVARAAGETAPLILATSVFDGSKVQLNPFEAMPNIPVTIYKLSEEANPEGFTKAWGAGLVLLSFIMFSSLVARALLARSKRKLGG